MAPSASAGTAAIPGCERGAEPLRKIRIVDEAHRQAGKRLLDVVALVAGDDDHGRRARRQRLLGGDAHQRPARDLRQELVRSAHAGRAAGGEHDGGDAARCGDRRLRRAAAAA